MGLRIAKIGAVACVTALALTVFAGCFGSGTQANDANSKNRTYMSQVNQIMVELDENLESFTDAVSRNDVVNMGNQLDSALKTLDKLNGIDVPAAMKEAHDLYTEAAATLGTALKEYVALYVEIDGAVQGDTADWAKYKDRVAMVQEQYNEGVAALKEADEAAAKVSSI